MGVENVNIDMLGFRRRFGLSVESVIFKLKYHCILLLTRLQHYTFMLEKEAEPMKPLSNTTVFDID